MLDKILSFFDRHESFIITTHNPADADGLGAELVFSAILKKRKKNFRIINASPVPPLFRFMDPYSLAEQWDAEKHQRLAGQSALLVVDTSDEYYIGCMKEILRNVREVFAVDHHPPQPIASLAGVIIPEAASTSELAIETSVMAGLEIDPISAFAAYTGIVYDTGFFSFSKTSLKTFYAAIKAIECGAQPHYSYHKLMESASRGALLLQKQSLSTLEFYEEGRIAVQTLRKEDFLSCGANFEDAEILVNIPLKAKEVEVSLLIKETPDGEVRCSLRSKGKINVSKVAQVFGGGGHAHAAGFKSRLNQEETLKKLLECVIAKFASYTEDVLADL